MMQPRFSSWRAADAAARMAARAQQERRTAMEVAALDDVESLESGLPRTVRPAPEVPARGRSAPRTLAHRIASQQPLLSDVFEKDEDGMKNMKIGLGDELRAR